MFNPDFEHELILTVSRSLEIHLQYEHEHASEVVAETVLRLLIQKAGFHACIQGFANVVDELEVSSNEISGRLEKIEQLYKENPSLNGS